MVVSGLNTQSSTTGEDFSLVLGGPLYQIFRRAYLSGSALELLRRRLIVLMTITWLPLLLLSVGEGHAWGRNVNLPFLYDIDANAKFLIALPVLIAGELTMRTRRAVINR